MQPPEEVGGFPRTLEPAKDSSTRGGEHNGQQEDTPIEPSRPGAERPHGRRKPGPQPEYVNHPGFPPIRRKTLTELREGLDEDMERAAWGSKPVSRADMMSLADRQATLGEREEESEE